MTPRLRRRSEGAKKTADAEQAGAAQALPMGALVTVLGVLVVGGGGWFALAEVREQAGVDTGSDPDAMIAAGAVARGAAASTTRRSRCCRTSSPTIRSTTRRW